CNASLFAKGQRKFLLTVLLTELSDLDIVLGALGAGLTMLASFGLIALIAFWGLVPGALPINLALSAWEVMVFTALSIGSLTILTKARGRKGAAVRGGISRYVGASTCLWFTSEF